MPPEPKRWNILPRLPADVEAALRDFPAVFRQILYNRGQLTVESARRYLEAAPPEGTDPGRLAGVQAAVDCILWAIDQGQLVAVFGDYDVDGVTATVLLVQTLTALGAKARAYIPNRFEEGYGLNTAALDELQREGVRLVIAVDCGIRSLAEAQHARERGLELIIIDHHNPGPELPSARAVINPKQPGDGYPEKDLAGVGLAYRLASALLEARPAPGLRPEDMLDLVALGTVADIVPLTGENRALVRRGLLRMRRPRRQGLLALMGVAGVTPERVSAGDIGFVLGPRLNAAGRLDSALAAYRLLISKDIHETGKLAQQLDNWNRERQKITQEIQEKAERMALERDGGKLLLFAADPEFNSGVVGLAASRLADLHHRPAIVAQKGDTLTRGSCRSIPEFNITAALDRCADLLVKHGGHASAAGFTIQNEQVAALLVRLDAIVQDQLGDLELRPTLEADAEIPLSALGEPGLMKYLDQLQPTGYGNRGARFVTRDLQVKGCRAVGRDGSHLKFAVTDGRVNFDAIAFRQGHWQQEMPARVDLLYTLEINYFNAREWLQLNVKDLRRAGSA